MRVQVVDPSAYTPPYDRSLCAALARAGADVELVTSRFLYGPVPPADGYRVSESFYRHAARRGLDAPGRRAFKLAEHLADMTRFRRHSIDADVVHYQWLTMPGFDWALLRGPAANGTRGRPPQVFTAHDRPLPGPFGPARERRLLSRMDAVIVHSEHGARRLREQLRFDAERIHVIPHGAFDYLTRLPEEEPLPPELARSERPVVLCFGLIRPHKGVEVLLEAFRTVPEAELWIVGMPRMPVEPLRALAARVPGDRVRFVPRFIPDAEVPAYFRRADLVVLPHLQAEQSGVLHIALAFGRPLVLSAVGGFSELAREDDAAVLVPPGDPAALAAALSEVLADDDERARLGSAAAAAAAGSHSWDRIATRTLDLYRSLRN